jgi:hypothetical protein
MNAKRDIAVLIILALTFLILESAFRVVEKKLEGNLKHISDIKNIVNQFSEDKRPNILFVGNSLINEAVDVEQLNKSLDERYYVNKITPDGTSLWDWNMILTNNILEANVELDYLVIGFAWGLLSDDYQPNASRLGGYFAEIGDLPTLYRYGMSDFAEVSEFLIGGVSRLYVNREAIRNKILARFIPHYKQYVREQNQAGAPVESAKNAKPRDHFSDHDMLNDLLDQLDDKGVKLIVMAMPVKSSYQVNRELEVLLNKRAYAYMDYREIFRSENEIFKDGIHLNNKGRSNFTKIIGETFMQEENRLN